MTNGLQLSKIIKEYAYKEGFHLVAITSADPLNDFQYYREWLDQGYGADMEYLKRHAAQKENPKHIFPEVQSIICCALSYKTDIQNPIHAESDEGIISNYAWGDDYHEIMWQKLENVLEKMKTFIPELQGKVYCDTGPVLERSFAKRAGIGWIGKNTCVINKKYGSYIFLGEILVNVDLAKLSKDEPETDHCGSCTRCLDACPTGALIENYKMDATKCIAYLTVEKKGEFTSLEKFHIGNHVFGCDICQQVCPWNDKALTPNLEFFRPRQGSFLPKLQQLQTMTPKDFQTQFKNSPVKRTKYEGLMRNVTVCMEERRVDIRERK